MSGKAIILPAITSVPANHTPCFVPEKLSIFFAQRRAMDVITIAVIVLGQVLASLDQVVAIAIVGAILLCPLLHILACLGVGRSGQGMVETLLGFVEVEIQLLGLGLWVAKVADHGVVAAGHAADFGIACSFGVADWLPAFVICWLVVLFLGAI